MRTLTLKDQTIGSEMRQRREKLNLKASWVATELGVSETYLSMLESGERRWSNDMIQRFRKVLGQ